MAFFLFLSGVVSLFFLWSSHPVHTVLTLVVLGLSLSGVLLANGLEFTALLLVLVYVGAVTVLFVFVVMMVNLRSSPTRYVTAEAYPIWFLTLGGVLTVTTWIDPSVGFRLDQQNNLASLGQLLYGTDRLVCVLLVGALLFVAMVAAICLSLVTGENYRTQEIYSQIRKSNSVFVLR